ncbi:MAG: DUF7010 family protein [Galactobacter sp.]
MKESAAPGATTLADARHQADVLHRSGGVSLLTLAAFWGIAAALAQWGTPTAGQIALLLGTLAAHPVSWLVLKLVGGPVMLPRSNPLVSLFYEIVAIQVAGVVVGIMTAQSKPSLFFAISLMGLGAGLLPTAFLYGKNLYLLAGAIMILVPAICAFVATPLVPWFGLIGVVLLVVTGGLFLRLDGGIGLPLPSSILGERVGNSGESTGTGSGELSASSAAPKDRLSEDDDPYGLRDSTSTSDGSYDATDNDGPDNGSGNGKESA